MLTKTSLTSLLVAVALFASGVAGGQAEEARTIGGRLQYRERIALPEDAFTVVEARGWRDTLLGEARIPGAGRQVPLPFTMEIPAGVSATLVAGIVADGRARWISEAIDVAAGIGPLDLGVVPLRAYEAILFPSTYRCGGKDIRVGVLDDNAVMEVDGERFTMIRTISASGSRYEAVGDPRTYFWSKGDKAFVSLRGDKLDECTRLASETPAPYVARGHEPDWSLAIDSGKATLIARMGEKRREVQLPPVQVEGGRYVFTLTEPEVRIAVSEILCRDSAVGMPYPDSVTINDRESTLTGCGGDPLALLTSTEWVVEDLDEGGIIDRSHLTLVFDGQGRVAGSGGCNAYNMPFSITGEGVSFGMGAGTMKACSEALANQERRFFQSLGEVKRFDIDPVSRALLLISSGDQIAVRARRGLE
jgi:heat shock protein HslJ/uncharacterized lipoprotein YbaY